MSKDCPKCHRAGAYERSWIVLRAGKEWACSFCHKAWWVPDHRTTA